MNTRLINEPLIMTATINIGRTPFVQLRNPEKRLLQYLCSLISWIKFSNIGKIIFCENSNTAFNFSKIRELASNRGKELEILTFNGNSMSLEYGKGWGEGEIIEYAINHSKILNKSTRFYKVTGRLFVENFTQIHATYTKYPNLFRLKEYQEEDNLLSLSSILLLTKWNINRYLFSQPHSNFVLRKLNKLKVAYFEKLVYTEFFKADVNFFKKNLLKSYKRVNERQNYFLEHVYYDDLIKKHMVTFLQENINMVGQFTLLNIVGTSASSGHLYSSDYSNEIKEIAKEFI